MKLFALIETVYECDCDSTDGIVTVFENKEEVGKYFVDKLVDRFNGWKDWNKDKLFDWESYFNYPNEPKIAEIETGKYYDPYSFNKILNAKDFLDLTLPIFNQIVLHNLDAQTKGPEFEKERKKKLLEQKKAQVQKLKEEIEELEQQA